jgi:eukaryotic-like serine/threonine-protein kinase
MRRLLGRLLTAQTDGAKIPAEMGDTSQRHLQLRAIFDGALLQSPPARAAYLDRVCAVDAELRSEVERLLAAHAAASSFLEHPLGAFPPAPLLDEDFRGTDRFAILQRLGAGGMGVVYQAHDRARDEVVALKTLRRSSGGDIYRLKQEFRSLADVSHPNLVGLYELFVEGDECFFTMELVPGVSFVDYVRSGSALTRFDRAAMALRQLVEGVAELHRLGKLHRDIKPSNVIVTPEGRVVILDFGLITELFPERLGHAEQVSGGTPAYVSPEEASGGRPSEAGDWYSVGATLYEALTGHLPFRGAPLDVMRRKREIDPPSAADLAPDVPDDLSSICTGLLCRDPARRLTGRDAVARLSVSVTQSPASQSTLEPSVDVPFVGRTRELARLNEAFCTLAGGQASALYVSGPSGIGKTALLRSFLARVIERDDVAVLAGRCYEHESVPYKAMDGVVDSLSRYIVSLPPSVADDVMPDDVTALPRLFPVMLRVPAIARACRAPELAISDPQQLRRRAFDALRELVARIAGRARVIVYIDDLQWADVDGMLLLGELLRPPDAPAVLTVVSFRSEEVETKPFLQKLVAGQYQNAWSALLLEPMLENEAGQLIDVLAGAPVADDRRQQIAGEARGSPFFLEQLTRYAVARRASAIAAPTFTQMFETRVRDLSDGSRRFLHTLAVCGRPMSPELVCEAAGLRRETRALVASLRAAHFIRSSGSSERVEAYHDRIREALAGQLSSSEVRRIHGLVARAIVAKGIDDPEALFDHYRAAGDRELASVQAGRAAERAAAALAFDRAALFYGHALDLDSASPAAAEWRTGRAQSLANAGRPPEAAAAYLAAARDRPHRERIDLQHRAAEQFLIGGHIDDGLDMIREVLDAVGLHLSRNTRTALASIVWHRARLRWRGLGFLARSADEVDRDDLLRIDTSWSVITGLAAADLVKAADLSARHVLLSLEAGEPSRIARALAFESVAEAVFPTGRGFRESLVRESKALATSAAYPPAVALSILADGITAMAAGQWKKAFESSARALPILREQCVGLTWELTIAHNLHIWALMYLGELAEVGRLVPPLLADARRRGNLALLTELCTRGNYYWLAADEPDEGERETIDSIARWSHKGFHRQHYSAMLARVQTALYRGNGEAAWRLLDEQAPLVRSAGLTRMQVIRVELLYMRARSALALAATTSGPTSRRYRSIARDCAQRIARERMPWSDPIALLVTASIAYLEGDPDRAVACLNEAVEQFGRADMSLYVAVAKRRIGSVQRDAAGRELRRESENWMAAQTIKNPPRMTRMLAPGFPDEA